MQYIKHYNADSEFLIAVSICSNTLIVGCIVFLVSYPSCLDDSFITSLFVVDMMNLCKVVSTVS